MFNAGYLIPWEEYKNPTKPDVGPVALEYPGASWWSKDSSGRKTLWTGSTSGVPVCVFVRERSWFSPGMRDLASSISLQQKSFWNEGVVHPIPSNQRA